MAGHLASASTYKYQLSDKSFGSALSVGPYLGYRLEDRGSSLTYLVSAGFVDNIPVLGRQYWID